ncbi:MerC family mercury resistance protein [Stenotrophomonas sp. 24(2023)]|uniref:MerC family mercury resistance protein n=1 Tax=Stenotrophomonas sp. 24(2023) TaxID=3068324 RepID=UPI0027E10590|nr:MerC family mercury resistance protein [Stenotrophomonas sp. 24(2023)]WMJ69331.1 MerC family mercury resistance protein [Stenotrophomonas sp. 24(2023)]
MDHIPSPPARARHSPSPSRSPHWRWHPRLDLAGAWISLACALHCLALPLLLAFVPAAMMAMRSFQHPAHGLMTALLVMSRWEWLFALMASSLALSSTATGWRRHGHRAALLLALAGALPLLAASLYLPLKESLLWHGIATACGGVLLAAAHLLNRRALHVPHR